MIINTMSMPASLAQNFVPVQPSTKSMKVIQENEDGTAAIVMAPPKPAPVRVMVDLETWGTAPGSAIASIGAVKFDESGITDKFYMRVDVSSCLKAGMKIDFSTVQWWMKQSEEARQEIGKDGMKLDRVLMEFRAFCKYTIGSMEKGEIELWGNGASFDNSILGAAYDACNIESPWQRDRGNRCYRTMKNMFPHVKMPERVGTHHHGLDDAETQALHLIEILKVHEEKTLVRSQWLLTQAELATVKGELERMQAKRQSFDEWVRKQPLFSDPDVNDLRAAWNAALAYAPVDDPAQQQIEFKNSAVYQSR